MLVFNKKSDLKEFLAPFIAKQNTIGFVPTMGALHNGHMSLIEKSAVENHKTVVSIFVNPTQFNNMEDLEKYPRTLEIDVEKIATVNPEVIVYAPSVEDIYENSTISKKFDFEGIENQMEGKHRPGHFDGVGTIVKKLFEIVNPTNAYFGEKDFQQLQIVKKMVSLHNINITVKGCPIFREKNGLAMSSRNERLSVSSREKAAILYENLKLSKKLFQTKSAQEIEKKLHAIFNKEKDFTLEYFEICEEETLLPCKRKNKNKKYRAFIAIFIDNIRLIDNISLN
uniref:pantoate--beta-alanine ligase n=1 Tax=Flavobacterium sp. TaxID=239 RepID=UPI00404AC6D6